MFERALPLPEPGTETFFLWGPRQTGKSTLLRATYPDARWIDLLKNEEYRRYLQHPERLRQELQARPVVHVVIDEIQKVPALLDEVHWLIENTPTTFALCGSSARKVKRGAANLLGGRAIRYELHSLTAREFGNDFDLDRFLTAGGLPRIYQSERPARLLEAYVADYLAEEVAAEALVRNLPAFSMFLEAAALSDTTTVNFTNIARECGVSGPTVKSYFDILVDTMLGRFLPAYVKRARRRVVQRPKFYFSDVGVAGHLARRGRVEAGGELYGKALESWVFHELATHLAYSESLDRLSYWRTAGGVEVDFVIGELDVAVEVKASRTVTNAHLKGLRELQREHPSLRRRLVVSLEPEVRETADGILIVPASQFAPLVSAGL